MVGVAVSFSARAQDLIFAIDDWFPAVFALAIGSWVIATFNELVEAKKTRPALARWMVPRVWIQILVFVCLASLSACISVAELADNAAWVISSVACVFIVAGVLLAIIGLRTFIKAAQSADVSPVRELRIPRIDVAAVLAYSLVLAIAYMVLSRSGAATAIVPGAFLLIPLLYAISLIDSMLSSIARLQLSAVRPGSAATVVLYSMACAFSYFLVARWGLMHDASHPNSVLASIVVLLALLATNLALTIAFARRWGARVPRPLLTESTAWNNVLQDSAVMQFAAILTFLVPIRLLNMQPFDERAFLKSATLYLVAFFAIAVQIMRNNPKHYSEEEVRSVSGLELIATSTFDVQAVNNRRLQLLKARLFRQNVLGWLVFLVPAVLIWGRAFAKALRFS
jgi:hypothetical protein